MKIQKKTAQNILIVLNSSGLLFIAFYYFIAPSFIITKSANEEGIKTEGISPFAKSLHQKISAEFEPWAEERVAEGKAEKLELSDISGTEWPLFGSVFYLWSTENIFRELPEKDKESFLKYSLRSANAAVELIVDPKHATWVRKHWGENYLHHQNVFYRMLLISGLTSHYHISGDKKYFPILKDQVLTLSKELEDSKTGLLDDYPGECYPSVILSAIANIQRASKVLGIDKTVFVRRAERAFLTLHDETGLPTYSAEAISGQAIGVARGNSNSFLLTFAPEIYPEKAKKWFSQYEANFWQERFSAVGFREFPKNYKGLGFFYMDVDAGPVIGGYGAAANAFGVAAARANGRLDLAAPLSHQMLTVSWPLPSGNLLIPSFLSSAADAPLIGEIGVLFSLTVQPAKGIISKQGKSHSPFAWIVSFIYAGIGIVVLRISWKKWSRREELSLKLKDSFLFLMTVLSVLSAICLFFSGYHFSLLILALSIQLLVFK